MRKILSASLVIESAKASKSMRQFLLLLGLSRTNGNYRTYVRLLSVMGVDTSHWQTYCPRSMSTDSSPQSRPLKEVLIENSDYSGGRLKHRLIEAGLLKDVCSECNQDKTWNGKPLVMVLDHINGISSDHRLENLRLLCPNCNSQQATFCRHKNKKAQPLWECSECRGHFVRKQLDSKYLRCLTCRKKHAEERDGDRRKKSICPSCGGLKGTVGKVCIACHNKAQAADVSLKKMIISKDELERLVWEMPTERVAKQFGVTGKAVEKRCKKLGIKKPPRGYWAKLRAQN